MLRRELGPATQTELRGMLCQGDVSLHDIAHPHGSSHHRHPSIAQLESCRAPLLGLGVLDFVSLWTPEKRSFEVIKELGGTIVSI